MGFEGEIVFFLLHCTVSIAFLFNTVVLFITMHSTKNYQLIVTLKHIEEINKNYNDFSALRHQLPSSSRPVLHICQSSTSLTGQFCLPMSLLSVITSACRSPHCLFFTSACRHLHRLLLTYYPHFLFFISAFCHPHCLHNSAC
jgi:hypothetical protein